MARRFSRGSFLETDVASATTCDIGATLTLKACVTGTTTITSLGTQANKIRYLRFSGVLLLTHNATSLILPRGGLSITTAAGDTCTAVSDPSGNWRVFGYARASGKAITGPAMLEVSDYDEGVWTPDLTFATPGNLSVAYSTQVGSYTRIGRKVTVAGCLVTSTFTHTTASGALRVATLPLTSANITGLTNQSMVSWSGITKAGYTSVSAQIASNSTNVSFNASGSGVAVSAVIAADMPTGGTVVLRFTTTYQI